MITLNDFEELNLNITWKLLDIGFMGNTKFRNELTSQEIIDYATFEMNNGNGDEDIISLSCEHNENSHNIDNYLNKLALKENSTYELEFRK